MPLNLVGDGLLPPDMDGNRRPIDGAPAPIVGTQDDAAGYGATFDALNIWELSIKWSAHPTASITLAAQLPTAPFDSIYPCAPTSRDCLPEPGIVNPAQYLDILSTASGRPFGSLTGISGPPVAGDQPVGRGGARRCRRPVVRDPKDRQPATANDNIQHLPTGDVRSGRRRPSLDGQHRAGQEREYGSWL